MPSGLLLKSDTWRRKGERADLYEEVYERPLLVGRVADYEHPSVLRQVGAAGDDCAHVRVVLVLEDYEVLGAHEHSPGPIRLQQIFP